MLGRGSSVSGCEDPSALISVAGKGDFAKVKRLVIDCGLDPNARNNIGWTPLHSAAYRCHIEVVRVLLEHRADPTIRN
jgi:ankyrin repeat protein